MDKNKLYSNRPLRIGVGIALLNKDNKIFVGKRIDNPVKFWQMPQGGVNNKEKYLDAALRELKEETSIESVKLIKEINYWTEYDLPSNLIRKIWKGRFRGQKQKWFLMKFMGEDREINLKTKRPEFIEWKWISVKDLTDVVVEFKLEVYKKVQKEIVEIVKTI